MDRNSLPNAGSAPPKARSARRRAIPSLSRRARSRQSGSRYKRKRSESGNRVVVVFGRSPSLGRCRPGRGARQTARGLPVHTVCRSSFQKSLRFRRGGTHSQYRTGCTSDNPGSSGATQSLIKAGGLPNSKNNEVDLVLGGGFEDAFARIAELNQDFRLRSESGVGGHQFAQTALIALNQIFPQLGRTSFRIGNDVQQDERGLQSLCHPNCSSTRHQRVMAESGTEQDFARAARRHIFACAWTNRQNRARGLAEDLFRGGSEQQFS